MLHAFARGGLQNVFCKAFCTSSMGTMSSLKVYAFVLGDRTARMTLAKPLVLLFFDFATTFLAMIRGII